MITDGVAGTLRLGSGSLIAAWATEHVLAEKESHPSDSRRRSLRSDHGSSVEMVHVLREDPGLAAGLPAAQFDHVERVAVAPLVHVLAGVHDFGSAQDATSSHLGLLVLDGLIARHVTVDEITSTEILGLGDLLRPWQEIRGGATGVTTRWEALVPTRLAELDRDFADRVRAWPQIASVLLDKATAQADTQLLYSVFRQARRVEDRVLFTLAHFADRWGVVTGEGRVAPTANITGEVLARIVGARRQSVSTALGTLAARGAIRRRPDGNVVLLYQPRHLHIVPAEEQPLTSTPRRRGIDRRVVSS